MDRFKKKKIKCINIIATINDKRKKRIEFELLKFTPSQPNYTKTAIRSMFSFIIAGYLPPEEGRAIG